MTDFRIVFNGADPVSLPDGTCLGVIGEHNAVQLVITLPTGMVTDMDYHVVTIGGVGSARIENSNVNADGAYRVENVIYMPLGAGYTTRRIVDLTVTAYRQTADGVQVIDISPTVRGLQFEDGQPREAVGGLVAEVAKLDHRVDELEGDVSNLDGEIAAIREDVPSSEEINVWNEAAAEKHTHENADALRQVTRQMIQASHSHENERVLRRLSESEETYRLKYRGVDVGVPVYGELPTEGDVPDACFCYGNIYLVDVDDQGNTVWVQITSGITPAQAASLLSDEHTHANQPALDKLTDTAGIPHYNGKSVYAYIRDFLLTFRVIDGDLYVDTSTGLATIDENGDLWVDDSIVNITNNELEVFAQ